MIKLKPIVQSAWWVQTSAFSHYFTTFSGIKDTATSATYADGVTNRIFQLKGPRTLAASQISTPFDPNVHKDIVDFWKSYGNTFVTITVTPVENSENPSKIGPQIIIPDAQFTGLNFGQADRTSSNVSMIELDFILDSFQYN